MAADVVPQSKTIVTGSGSLCYHNMSYFKESWWVAARPVSDTYARSAALRAREIFLPSTKGLLGSK